MPQETITPSEATLLSLARSLLDEANARIPISSEELSRLCEHSFLCAHCIEHARQRPDGSIGVKFVHQPTRGNPPIENERILDALTFAALLLMCIVGGRVSVSPHPLGEKLYYYLRYEHQTDKSEDKRVYLTRIVREVPSDRTVKFLEDHHDYRLANLKLTKPDPRMREPKLGRADAIRIAGQMLEATPPATSENISREDYESLLGMLFSANDAVLKD